MSIQNIFFSYMDKLIQKHFVPLLYLPSHLESLREKHDYVEVHDFETKIRRFERKPSLLATT